MEILISGSAQFENLWVPENNDYNFMVKEKKLTDDILHILYEKNGITRDSLIISRKISNIVSTV